MTNSFFYNYVSDFFDSESYALICHQDLQGPSDSADCSLLNSGLAERITWWVSLCIKNYTLVFLHGVTLVHIATCENGIHTFEAIFLQILQISTLFFRQIQKAH